MKIALIQHDITWADPTTNIHRVNEAINKNPGADIYIMPEMFTTGFIINPQNIAEPVDSPSLHWMQDKASEINAALAGSIAIEENGRYYNRFFFVTPDRNVTTYDKSHLFKYGGEGVHFTAGTQRVITEFRGVRILLEICYDLRFPMWCRNQIDQGGKALYDLIIYVAEWPESRRLAWEVFTRSRAIENQCYVAAVNRVGSDDWGKYFGGSVLIHPYGHPIAQCDDYIENEAIGEIDMPQLIRYRDKFPVLSDIIWSTDATN